MTEANTIKGLVLPEPLVQQLYAVLNGLRHDHAKAIESILARGEWKDFSLAARAEGDGDKGIQ